MSAERQATTQEEVKEKQEKERVENMISERGK